MPSPSLVCRLAGVTVLVGLALLQQVFGGSSSWAPANALAQRQMVPFGTAQISGRVVDADSGAPVAGAEVVTSPSSPGRPMLTDADGRFVLRNLARRLYRVSARAAGYANGYHGQLRPGGASLRIPLADGEHASAVVIRLWKSGTIGGVVLDDAGQPVGGATMEIRTWQPRGHGGRLGLSDRADTDADGRYRFVGVRPAEYMVAVLFTPTTVPVSVLDEFERALSSPAPEARALVETLRATRLWIQAGPAPPGVARGYEVVGPDGLVPAPAELGANGQPLVFRTTFHPDASTVAGATPVRVAPARPRSTSTSAWNAGRRSASRAS